MCSVIWTKLYQDKEHGHSTQVPQSRVEKDKDNHMIHKWWNFLWTVHPYILLCLNTKQERNWWARGRTQCLANRRGFFFFSLSRSNGLLDFRSNELQVVALMFVFSRSFVLSIRSNAEFSNWFVGFIVPCPHLHWANTLNIPKKIAAWFVYA
jgi:hypothetical protein